MAGGDDGRTADESKGSPEYQRTDTINPNTVTLAEDPYLAAGKKFNEDLAAEDETAAIAGGGGDDGGEKLFATIARQRYAEHFFCCK